MCRTLLLCHLASELLLHLLGLLVAHHVLPVLEVFVAVALEEEGSHEALLEPGVDFTKVSEVDLRQRLARLLVSLDAKHLHDRRRSDAEHHHSEYDNEERRRKPIFLELGVKLESEDISDSAPEASVPEDVLVLETNGLDVVAGSSTLLAEEVAKVDDAKHDKGPANETQSQRNGDEPPVPDHRESEDGNAQVEEDDTVECRRQALDEVAGDDLATLRKVQEGVVSHHKAAEERRNDARQVERVCHQVAHVGEAPESNRLHNRCLVELGEFEEEARSDTSEDTKDGSDECRQHELKEALEEHDTHRGVSSALVCNLLVGREEDNANGVVEVALAVDQSEESLLHTKSGVHRQRSHWIGCTDEGSEGQALGCRHADRQDRGVRRQQPQDNANEHCRDEGADDGQL
mmetsp:Transcript_9881/g.40053  ORF Transcript_9881/g.40053 Transcript_9881/m.40053 type:complete len:404 (-) Transcript_9881:420-1631(-)